MKKILIFLSVFLCFTFSASASTNTYKRTDDNLLVPDGIKITNQNKSNILNTPAVDENEKIYDFANLLTENEEENLYSSVKSFINETNYDLAIVTINKNNKKDEVEYADDFYDYNNFGLNSTRDGLLFLIDMDNRIVYISTTGYAIKMYSDERKDNIIDAGYNNLKNAKYYDCLNNMVQKSLSLYKLGFPSGNSRIEIDEHGKVIQRIPILTLIFCGGVFCLIVTLILYFKSKSTIKVHNTVSYLDIKDSTLNKNTRFISTHTSKVRRTESSGSGGSSFHSGSSGISHGGGGRHF